MTMWTKLAKSHFLRVMRRPGPVQRHISQRAFCVDAETPDQSRPRGVIFVMRARVAG
jgi:hypothetical protein